jgi:hypothetical protein
MCRGHLDRELASVEADYQLPRHSVATARPLVMPQLAPESWARPVHRRDRSLRMEMRVEIVPLLGSKQPVP